MIHTIEVRYVLSENDFYMLIQDIYDLNKFDKKKLDRFLHYKNGKFILPNLPTGINRIEFYYNAEIKSTLYIKIQIDLQALSYGLPTVDLFQPSLGTTFRVCVAYAEAILKVFPSLTALKLDTSVYTNKDSNIEATACSLEALPYLMLSTTTQIDYSMNMRVAEKDKKAVLTCIKGSYYSSTKKISKFDKHVDGTKNLNLYAENKLSSTKVYDKQRYYKDKKIQISDELREASANILRFEYSVRNNLRNFILKEYNLPYKFKNSPFLLSPVAFFDYDDCNKNIMTIYSKEIDTKDWYNKDRYKKIINKSSLSEHKKSAILEDIAPTLSIARSTVSALEKYVNGYVHPQSHKKIKGSAATFKSYLNEIRSLNLQPFRIPGKANKTHIINPVSIIQHNRWNVKPDYDIPKHIFRNIEKLLFNMWLNELHRTPLPKWELTKKVS